MTYAQMILLQAKKASVLLSEYRLRLSGELLREPPQTHIVIQQSLGHHHILSARGKRAGKQEGVRWRDEGMA
jgi:hypothetical protein